MKLILISLLFLFSSCQWLNKSALSSWTRNTVDTLLEMSLRKSMIHDTPLKTMEALDSPPGIDLKASKLCRCAESLYGGILGVVANSVKASSVKRVCKSMGDCFFKGRAPEEFKLTCIEYFKDNKFKKMAGDRNKSLKRFTRARRLLASHCSKL
jgi:hypothetical protein